jgi:signal transduction histidine kinase
MLMKQLIILVLIFSHTVLFAQHPSVDSLGRIAKGWAMKKPSFQRDTNLILAFNDYVFYKNYFKETDTKIYLDSLEKLINKTNWQVGRGLLLWAKCNYVINFEQEKGPKAINLAISALETLKKERNQKALFYANMRMASIMLWTTQTNPNQKADGLAYAKKAVEHALAAKDTSIICHGLAYVANHYIGYNKQYAKEALEILQEGERLITKSKVSYFAENLIFGTFAGYYSDQGNTAKAIEYIEKTLASGLRENDLYCQASMHEFRGYLAENSIKPNGAEVALPHFEKAHSFAKKLDDVSVLARIEQKLYGNYRWAGNTKKALEVLELYIAHQATIDKKNIQKAYADFDFSSKELKIKELENQQLTKDKSLKILENQSLLKDRDNKIKELNFLKLIKLNGDSLAAQKEEKIMSNLSLSQKEVQIKTLENQKLNTENEKNNLLRNVLIASLLAGLGLVFYIYKNNLNLQSKNKELVHKNTEIEAALLKGQTIERKRVAQELHDNLSAKISGIRMRMEAIKPNFGSEKEEKIYLSTVIAMAEVYTDVRLISHNLLPADLEAKGLASATQNLVNELNSAGKTQFKFDNLIDKNRYSSKIEYEIFSIILELSNNIMKHSKATTATVSISEINSNLKLSVADNGIGIIEEMTKKGMGFANLHSRVEALNGKISHVNNGGLKVVVTVPR